MFDCKASCEIPLLILRMILKCSHFSINKIKSHCNTTNNNSDMTYQIEFNNMIETKGSYMYIIVQS